MRQKQFRDVFSLERIGDIEVGGRAIGGFERLSVSCNLFECAGQSLGVAREERAGRVGERFAFAGDGQLDEHRGERRQDGENDSGDHQDHLGLAFIIAIPIAAIPCPMTEPVRQKRHEADQDHDDGRDERVAVADMGEFVGDHPFQFRFFQAADDAGREADDAVLGIASRRERVERAVFDDIDFRQRQAGGDAQILDEAIDLLVVREGELVRAAHQEHDPIAPPV